MNSVVVLANNIGNMHSLFPNSKMFCFNDEELPLYKIDNRTQDSNNKIMEKRCSNNRILEIKRYIKRHFVKTIVFALPNECLKLVTEEFVEFSYLDGFVLLSGANCNNSEDYQLYPIDLDKPRLRMIQINLSQHCNLNCRGCANYSNLVDIPQYSDYDQVYNDLKALKNYFWGIETIKLMGGEPTLNHEMRKYFGMVRMLYPDSHIELATNGLRINMLDPSVFAELKENNITVVISLYPKTRHIMEEIEKVLLDNKVNFKIYTFSKYFMKYLSEFPIYAREEGFLNCPAKECHCLENGFLAVCGRPLYVCRLNNRFGTHIPDGEGKINIHSTEMTPWEIETWLKTPFETCSYCGPKELFEWDVSNISKVDKKDWLI